MLLLGSALISGCSANLEEGRYLLGVVGSTPNSNAVYVVDPFLSEMRPLCSEMMAGQRRCSYARTSLNPNYVVAAAQVPEPTRSAEQIGILIIVYGKKLRSSLPNVCSSCEPLDLSVTPDGSIVTAVLFSRESKRSSVWTLRISNPEWIQQTQWVEYPAWVTRSVSDTKGRYIYFLRAGRTASGVSSVLVELDTVAHKEKLLLDGRNVAAYALGPEHAIAAWTANGVEFVSDGQNPTTLSTSSVLAAKDTLRPDGMVWDGTRSRIAIAVCDQESGIARIIEANLQTRIWQTVFRKRAGKYVSLQLVDYTQGRVA